MIQSAVTISLVYQAQGGPFIFKDDLHGSMRRAAEIGYDAVELFLPGPDHISPGSIQAILSETGLKIAAVGTGAGMVIHHLSLTDPEPSRRRRAIDYVTSMIEFGATFGAPAIIGSMQGRWNECSRKESALEHLTSSLQELSSVAKKNHVPLIYEPLNRYETNLCNTLSGGVHLIESGGLENVLLLADLFHMNIEETHLKNAILNTGRHLGHVHFVDSNRRPAGNGHLDFGPIISALREIHYDGYLSAEAFPWPDSETAAQTTMRTFRRFA